MRIPTGLDYALAVLVMLALGIGASLLDRSSDPTSLIDLIEDFASACASGIPTRSGDPANA